MMVIDKKAAIAAYKERKTPAGIFAVRCFATGQVWVGRSQHLDTHQTGLWFSLKLGSFPNQALVAAWKTSGEASFTFEVVERLPDEPDPYVRQAALKERLAHWRNELGAMLI